MTLPDWLYHNTIYPLNCLDGLPRIHRQSVDAIITDPPYCIGTTSNGMKGTWTDNNLIIPFFSQLFQEWKRVLKDGGKIYVNTDWRTYPLLYPLLQKHFDIRNCIVWDYEWIKAGSHYRFSHEFIIYCTNGESKRNFSASERDVWRIKPLNFTDGSKEHQQEKPLELVRKMVSNATRKDDLVLDCFVGSGTTAIACRQLGRRFIGFEIDEAMCLLANKRYEDARTQTSLQELTTPDNDAGGEPLAEESRQ